MNRRSTAMSRAEYILLFVCLTENGPRRVRHFVGDANCMLLFSRSDSERNGHARSSRVRRFILSDKTIGR